MALAATVRGRGRCLALASALVLSACSVGGGGGRSDPGQTNAADSTERVDQGTSSAKADGYRAAEQDIEPQGQERAQAIPLTLSDLPDGWQLHEGGVGVIGECVEGDLSALTLIGAARGEYFQGSAVGRVTSAGQVFATEQMAVEELEILADQVEREHVERCITDLLGRHPDAPEIRADLRGIRVPPPSGVDEARAWQVAISYDDEEAPFTAYDQMVVLRDGSTTAFVLTWSFLTPFNPVLRNELLETVARRMAD
jgi:hypothetical protein